eukprot:237264_1
MAFRLMIFLVFLYVHTVSQSYFNYEYQTIFTFPNNIDVIPKSKSNCKGNLKWEKVRDCVLHEIPPERGVFMESITYAQRSSNVYHKLRVMLFVLTSKHDQLHLNWDWKFAIDQFRRMHATRIIFVTVTCEEESDLGVLISHFNEYIHSDTRYYHVVSHFVLTAHGNGEQLAVYIHNDTSNLLPKNIQGDLLHTISNIMVTDKRATITFQFCHGELMTNNANFRQYFRRDNLNVFVFKGSLTTNWCEYIKFTTNGVVQKKQSFMKKWLCSCPEPKCDWLQLTTDGFKCAIIRPRNLFIP